MGVLLQSQSLLWTPPSLSDYCPSSFVRHADVQVPPSPLSRCKYVHLRARMTSPAAELCSIPAGLAQHKCSIAHSVNAKRWNSVLKCNLSSRNRIRNKILGGRGVRLESGQGRLDPQILNRHAVDKFKHHGATTGQVGFQEAKCDYRSSKTGCWPSRSSSSTIVRLIGDYSTEGVDGSRTFSIGRFGWHKHPQTQCCNCQPRFSNNVPNGAARCSLVNGAEADISSNSTSEAGIPQSAKGVFPGGLRRAEVRLPGLVLRVRLEEVQNKEERVLLEGVSAAVAGGVTMVVLEAGGDGGMGGAKLYDAACALKAVLRGRAELLVAERVDIAAAAGADGVLLSDQGLPAVVARRMMQSTVTETSVLPLVARSVSSAQSALTATASEGADFLILKATEKEVNVRTFVKTVCDGISIPVFLESSDSVEAPARAGLDLLQDGANGLVLNASDIRIAAKEDAPRYVSTLMAAIGSVVQRRKDLEDRHPSGDGVKVLNMQDIDEDALRAEPQGVRASVIGVEDEQLELQAKHILEEERYLLTAMVELVKEAAPEMEEVSLLIDAVKQLDELFLLVIVGEFNSGKSSVINALLGKRFLKEGVLPTTNEITLLRHAGEGGDTEERSERHPDGHFLRFLPADLLHQMNLVDTPGTNVILQRQQRLTEEFVPRADLVLFVLSADRPLTESEVTFLRYIRQWGKKVIFILNKSDVLSTFSEVREVSNFIRDNVQRLLSVEKPPVYPVSARQAIQAKLSATSEDGSIDQESLSRDSLWTTSGFQELEDFIFGFMGASTGMGAERLRLKLETPLGIGVALLAACDRQLVAEALKAEGDLKALADVQKQLQRYEQAMQNDAILQQQRALAVIEAAKGRADKFIDSILRLSNIEAIAKYLIGGDRVKSMPASSGFDSRVIGSAVTDVRKALEEYEEWIASNSTRQLSSYRAFVSSRWPQVNENIKESTEDSPVVQLRNANMKLDSNNSSSLAVLEGFDTNAAVVLLDEELKEVVIGTFSGLGAAGVSASVLTTILPSTIEDLIALGVCSAGGLVGVWNLPLRRGEVKKKVTRVADSLARQIDGAMKNDLQQSIDAVRAEVEQLTRPYDKAAEEESIRVRELQKELQKLDSHLRDIRQRVQNLGT